MCCCVLILIIMYLVIYIKWRQPNGNDCGLFALAFAMAICLGQAPEDLHFNVKLIMIRSFLSSCLLEKKMKAFPSRRRTVKKRE